MKLRIAVVPALACAAALAFSADALSQQKQKVTYKASAADSKYTQRHMIEVGDDLGHTVGVFEIHRKMGPDAPSIAGVKLKEIWTRGYSDYMSATGLSTNYTVYVLENGDKFYSTMHTMGQADSAGKRSTIAVGEIRAGTGKVANIRGMVRAKGVSQGASNYNESETEIEYWLAN